MKKLFAVLAMSLVAGCSHNIRREVQKVFPSAPLEQVPGDSQQFIIKDGTNIYFYSYGPFWSSVHPLFGSVVITNLPIGVR